MRLRQLANNDVVKNPSDYITKAEHARILDSRLASKNHELLGELARRAADSERELAIRLKAQAAELQEAQASQMSKLQRRHEAELAERAQQLKAHDEEAQQAKRAVALAEEHVQSARDAQQRLQVTLSELAVVSGTSKALFGQKLTGFPTIMSSEFRGYRGGLWPWRRPSRQPRTSERKLCGRRSTCSTS